MGRWQHLPNDPCRNFFRFTPILYRTSKIHASRWPCGPLQQEIRFQKQRRTSIIFLKRAFPVLGELFFCFYRFFWVGASAPGRDRSPEYAGNLMGPVPMSPTPSKLKAKNVGRTPAKPAFTGGTLYFRSTSRQLGLDFAGNRWVCYDSFNKEREGKRRDGIRT